MASATPTRDKDRDRLPFPNSIHPSPGPQRSQTSPSTSHSTLPSSATSASLTHSQAISLHSLLKHHEAASDPKMAALDQAVNERNVLSAQNTQLWKLIEKQRSGYNQILKELDRIRAERDSYRAKVIAFGGSVEKKSHKGTDRATRPNADASDASPNPRHQVSRHHSDDNATPRLQPHHLHSSRSYEPLSLRNNDTSLQPSVSVSSTSIPHSQSPPPPPPASTPSTALPSTPLKSQRPSPAPLTVPPRSVSHSVPVSASSTTSPEEQTRPLQFRKGSITESVSSITSGTNHTVSTPATAAPSSNHSFSTYIQSQQPSHQPVATPQTAPLASTIQITMSPATPQTASSIQAQAQTSSLSAIPETIPLLPAVDPRISRISLPDEARQYIVNMVDSPVASPKLDTFAASKPKVSSNLVPQPQDDQVGQKGSGEFLDMEEDEDDVGEDGELDEDGTDVGSVQDQTKSIESDVPEFSTNNSTTALPDQQSLSSFSSFTDPFSDTPSQGQDSRQIRAAPEESPYSSTTILPQWQPPELAFDQSARIGQAAPGPNHSLINSSSAVSSSVPLSQPHHHRHTQQQQLMSSEMNYSSGSLQPYSPQGQHQGPGPTLIPPRMDSRPQHPLESTSTLSSLETTPMRSREREQYRALPLLSTDLPTTVVSVSQSFVRPNDRGKEVLSFVIIVNPGNGKEPWKVEKMYSDVVALDSRIRSSVGKSVAKRIVSLPEGKLWRDHAPAKVDQRKAVLESYLQSLVKLPVKNNDEAIAFLTSDIVRETRQPVMQAGHKEGYLTKRGKNFGGWKTRYFVLQGPVLEYYESRGGAHLGSIAITGAQIGRQQRSSDRQNSSNSNSNNPNGNSNHHDNDEKEYRHAFLIVEAKKGPGGSHPRHVLCAESDEERDAWVDMLVRYFTGAYSEEPLSYGPPSSAVQQGKQSQRAVSKDEISVSKGVPLSQLAQDSSNAKLFSTPYNVDEINGLSSTNLSVNLDRSASPVKSMEPSPVERTNSSQSGHNQNSNITAKRVLDRLQGLPSSLPDSSSPISAGSGAIDNIGPRPNSELGHYAGGVAETPDRRKLTHSPERHRNDGRKSSHPTPGTNNNSNNANSNSSGSNDRSTSPEKPDPGVTKVKISGPMGGTPIPSGFKFGKDKDKDENGALGGADSNGGGASGNRREKARSRFWPGTWRATTNGERQVAVVPRNVFGVPLEESLEVSQICNLPSIVFRSIEYLEAKKADQEEGIYRLSGSSAVIKSLKDRFNAEGDVNLLASDEYWDPHAIAGLLKSYLRELPASILTRDLHFRFLSVIDFVDAQERIRELSQLIASLPLANYSLLRALTAHLILIVQNASVNKMTMRNVGIVFSPTLGIPAGVFSLMLGEFNRVFNVDAGNDLNNSASASAEGQGGEGEDVLKRNSRQYSDAAADQVLGLGGRSLQTSADDPQSDADDYSVQDESGTETTGDGDMTAESASGSLSTPVRDGDQLQQQQQHTIRITPPDTPVASRTSKAAHTATSKGLNVNVSLSTPSRGVNRFSKVTGAGGVVGLPSSPRPPHSPSRLDTFAPSLE